MSTQTITEFLESRIAEDEAAARAALEDYTTFSFKTHRSEVVKTDEGRWVANTSNTSANVSGLAMEIELSTEYGSMNNEQAEHIARHDPARALAECAAKRAIVAEHVPVDPCDAHDAMFKTITCDTIRTLAAIYASHPDYQQEWAA